MPSSSYIPVSNRGLVKGFSKQNVGGAVPLLLSKIIKEPIRGGALEEKPRSNMMIGQVTKSIVTPERTATTSVKTVGGELVNNLSKLKFSKGGKTRENSNIRFIY
jgi:hypothetical protein